MTEARSLSQRAASALVWSYGGAFVRLAAQLVVQVLLARALGPVAFGQAMLVMVVLGLGWLLADAGFGSALIQKAELLDADISYALGWILLVSVSVGIVVFVAAQPLAVALGDRGLWPLLAFCGVMIPVQALSNVPTSLLRRKLDMKRQQLLQTVAYVVCFGGVSLTMAAQGYGAWSLVVGFAAQSLTMAIAGYLIVGHPLSVRLRGDAELRRFGLSVMGTNIANWSIDNLDRAIIGRLWGVEAVGNYGLAMNLARAPATTLVSTAQAVAFSAASRIQHDPQRVCRGLLATLNLVAMVAFPAYLLLGLHADLVVGTIYGDGWRSAAPLFRVLCAAMPWYALLVVAGPVLWALGGPASELKVQAAVAVLLMAGLMSLRDVPLDTAILIVPVLYFVRIAFVMAALSTHAALGWRRVGSSLVGGLVFAALFAGTAVVFRGLLVSPALAALSNLAVGLVLCAMVLRSQGRTILCVELRDALAARSRSSRGIRLFCSLTRVGAK